MFRGTSNLYQKWISGHFKKLQRSSKPAADYPQTNKKDDWNVKHNKQSQG